MALDSKGNGYSLQSTQDIELRIHGPIFSNFLSLGLRNCMDFTTCSGFTPLYGYTAYCG